MKKEFHPRRKHVVMLNGTRAIETHSFISMPNKETILGRWNFVSAPRIPPLFDATGRTGGHCKKKLAVFSARKSLVSDISAGDRKTANVYLEPKKEFMWIHRHGLVTMIVGGSGDPPYRRFGYHWILFYFLSCILIKTVFLCSNLECHNFNWTT